MSKRMRHLQKRLKKAGLVYLRPEDEPRFQNRKGPGGSDLHATEAMAWFPDLALAPAATEPIAGGSALVGYGHLRFWLHDIEMSVEPGFFFGNITEYLPDNSADLNADQNIGFEPRHVFAVSERV